VTAPQPLFILSFRQRDELAALATSAGWAPVAARRRENAAQRFLATGAAIAVIDARGALTDGLAAAAALGGPVAASGAAMLVLLSRGDSNALADFHDAGATHFLMSPHGEAEFLQALRYAARLSERLGGARPAALDPAAAEEADSLTGVRDAAAARRWLDRRLETAVAGSVHALLIGLTRFDILNTAYGRAAGDLLLRTATRRIEDAVHAALGREAIVARTGGSEFVVAAVADAAHVALAADAIIDALARPFVAADTVAPVGARLGMAGNCAGEQATALLRRASEALAEAKVSDSPIRHAGEEGAHPAPPIDTLAVDLRGALERGEIDIRFQPQVAVATGAIVGVEALARWEHRGFGVLGAEALFAAAERADLTIAVSDHIQKRALARAAAWPAALSGLRLAINLTAADVARAGFADLFLDRVDASRFPRARLTVEITEGGLIDDLGRAAQFFASLRAAGLRVAVDDFGTGYSSLAYLKALPLDYLKIDRALAQDIAGSPRDRIVVRGVIDMARSLGLAVIAEGVETEEQLELLAKEGCQYYQGFLCAEPLTLDALTALVAGNGTKE